MRLFALAAFASGCVPATVHGLRTDGLLPPMGTVEGAISLAAGAPIGEGDAVGGGAASVVVPLSDTIAVAPSFGFVGQAWGFDVEGRLALLDRDGLVVTALFGAGAVGPDEWTFGLHGGAVVSKAISDTTRLYGGARLNPVFIDELEDVTWVHVAMGISARPPDPKWSGLGFLGEVFWEIPLNEPDAAGLGAMLTVTARVGKTE